MFLDRCHDCNSLGGATILGQNSKIAYFVMAQHTSNIFAKEIKIYAKHFKPKFTNNIKASFLKTTLCCTFSS
ncbi:hypothetical protein B5X24_HaOG205735 [Helicoverpa armigera]|uniref:Uncharacterized protein n=1 Tax=Helicoverpa armigera TaxID=29058 RepID=A0A2W1BVB8_HELAM|nr:hypothetical protein B5X24_HaOG205735 [Helicoverpa armigera]